MTHVTPWRSLRIVRSLPRAATAMLAVAFASAIVLYAIGDALLFAPPAGVADPARLWRVLVQRPARTTTSLKFAPVVSYPVLVALRRSGVADFAAYAPTTLRVELNGEIRLLNAAFISDGFFDLIGPDALGGARRQTDEPSVILSARAASSAAGRGPVALRINGRTAPVVGATAPGFFGLDLVGVDLWVPARLARELGLIASLADPHQHMWTLLTRARPGISRDALASRLSVEIRRVDADLGERDQRSVHLAALGDDPAGSPELGRRVLSYAFFLLLGSIVAVAWSSTVVLLLMRTLGRQTELATRIALGAPRSAIVAIAAGEAAAVQAVSIIAGGGIAALALLTVERLEPDVVWRLHPATISLFALALLVAGTLTGAIPAILLASRVEVSGALAGRGAVSPASAGARRASFMLVGAQAALAVALFAVSGRVLDAVVRASRLDLGFSAKGSYAIRADVSRDPAIRTPEARRAVQRFVDQASGVSGSAWASTAPLISAREETFFSYGANGESREITTYVNHVQPAYFRTLSIRVVAGRGFDAGDAAGDRAAIVDEAAIRTFRLPRDPVGRCVRFSPSSERCTTIVGVVADVRPVGIFSDPAPTIYYPLADTSSENGAAGVLMTSVRGSTGGDASARLYAAIRRAGFDPLLFSVESLQQKRDAQTARWRNALAICLAGGILTLLVGVCGQSVVVSFDVLRRRREIGLRAALGAPRRTLVFGAARIPLVCSGLGIVAGSIVGILLGGRAMIWIGTESPASGGLVAAGVLVALAVIVASALYPARRAADVSPMVALQE